MPKRKPKREPLKARTSYFRVHGVTDAAINDGGKEIVLTINTVGGPALPVKLLHPELTRLIENLIALGTAASHQRTGGVPVPITAGTKLPISSRGLATQVGLAETEDRTQLMMLVRFFDMDLAFLAEKPTLQQAGEHFRQAVQALDADETVKH